MSRVALRYPRPNLYLPLGAYDRDVHDDVHDIAGLFILVSLRRAVAQR